MSEMFERKVYSTTSLLAVHPIASAVTHLIQISRGVGNDDGLVHQAVLGGIQHHPQLHLVDVVQGTRPGVREPFCAGIWGVCDRMMRLEWGDAAFCGEAYFGSVEYIAVRDARMIL